MTSTKQILRFKTAYYFPKTIRAIGAIFGLFGLAMMLTSPVLGVLFMFITMVIFTTHYGFEIAIKPNSIREYISVLGFREGKRNPFNAIDFIFIQPGKIRYLTYLLGERESDCYEAYLKFEGRNEMMMMAIIKKENLVSSMRGIASRLQVPIRDYSDGNPVVIYETN